MTTTTHIPLRDTVFSANFIQSYTPPLFTDPNRLSKIQAIQSKIEEVYREYSKKNHFPGYAYGVIVDGQLTFSGAGGFINLEKKIPATAQSMFRIASMTKSFTAMAILKLRDDNKLKLDDPAYMYIPEIKNQKFVEDFPIITIRDLLTHSAGFSTDDPWADRKLDNTEEEFLELLKEGVFFSNIPGITYEYSNLGYTLLGYIVRKITGISCAKFIDEMIGLNGISWDFTQVPKSQLAHGYRRVEDNWQEEVLLQDGIFGPMGGLIASIESFSQYASWHLSAWPPRNEIESGPLKRSSIREMHQPWRFRDLAVDKSQEGHERVMTSAYGYGLNWSRDNMGRIFVGHSGGLPGFGSNWSIMPEYGIGVVLLANVTYAPAAKVNMEVLDKIVKEAQLHPRELPPSNILKQRKLELIQILPEWNQASNIFAQNFFLDYPINALKQETKKLFDQIGKIISIGEMLPENQLRGYFIVKGEKAKLQINFSLTPQNPALIQEYAIKSAS